MILFLPFPIFVLEVFGFFYFVGIFGFWNTFLAYWAPSLLGILLLGVVGRMSQMEMMKMAQSGAGADQKMLKMAAKFLGSLALLPPMFLPRVFAILLLTPGVSSIFLWVIRTWFLSKLIHKMGKGGQFRAHNFQWESGQNESEAPQERDAEIIDIEPLNITHEDPKTKV